MPGTRTTRTTLRHSQQSNRSAVSRVGARATDGPDGRSGREGWLLICRIESDVSGYLYSGTDSTNHSPTHHRPLTPRPRTLDSPFAVQYQVPSAFPYLSGQAL